MAYCGNCGTQLSEGAKFCPKCGTSVSPVTNDNGGKSSSKKIIIPLVILILVLAIAGGGWYFGKNYGEDYSLEKLAAVVVDFDEVQEFHEGLASFKKGNKWGVIDKKGNVVVEPIYDGYGYGLCFQEGMAAVSKDGWKIYGFINSVGELSIPFSYDDVRPFSNGCAAVKKEEKWGFVNKEGQLIIPCKYESVEDFSEGYANVEKNGKWGFIDQSDNIVIPFKYTGASGRFSEGLAPFYGDNYNGYINYSGDEIITLDSKYYRIGDFHDGLACVESENGCGFIDHTGKVVIPEIYSSYRGYWSEFQDGYAIVYSEKESGFGVIDKSGKVLIPFKHGDITYSDGIFHVIENDKNVFYDTNGKCLSSINDIGDYSEGLAVIIKDDIYGYIDLKGNSTFDIENEKVKVLVQKKLKEKEEKKLVEERKREEERRRIEEEENKPNNILYNLAQNRNIVWSYSYNSSKKGVGEKERKICPTIYIYPESPSVGRMSYVVFAFSEAYESYGGGRSSSVMTKYKGTYSIIDNVIHASLSYDRALKYSDIENSLFKIEKIGNNLQLVEVNGRQNQVYKQTEKLREDPI